MYKLHDKQVEYEVLSTAIQSEVSRAALLARVSSDAFYDDVSVQVFDALMQLSNSGTHIDGVSLKMAVDGATEPQVDEVLCTPTSLMGFATRLEFLVEMQCWRRLKQAWDISTKGSVTPMEGAYELDRAVTEVRRLLSEFKLAPGLDLEDDDSVLCNTLHSGLPSMDSRLNEGMGLLPGDVLVIGGTPGTGKTALMCNMMLAMAKDVCVLGLSLEMTKAQLTRRLKKVDPLTIDKLSSNIIIEDVRGMGEKGATIDTIVSRIRYCADVYKVGAVFVDYLQLIRSDRFESKGRYQEVTHISRALKLLALSCDVPIVLLSQLNRNFNQRSTCVPILSDLRDSGQIEQDADGILFLYQDPSEDGDHIWGHLAKSRNGRVTGESERIKIDFDRQRQKMVEAVDKFRGTGYHGA